MGRAPVISTMPTACAALLLLSSLCCGGQLEAQERLLHLGANAGFATTTLPALSASGYGAGAQLAYGISDAFNLRVHADVSIYQLPEADSLLLWGGSAGIEYLLDVIDWVPYAGVMVGPFNAAFQQGADPWLLGVEVPFGLGYKVIPELMLAAEGRYRLLFLGGDTGPTSQLWLAARIEYLWDLREPP